MDKYSLTSINLAFTALEHVARAVDPPVVEKITAMVRRPTLGMEPLATKYAKENGYPARNSKPSGRDAAERLERPGTRQWPKTFFERKILFALAPG
ncbi:MAG: hypothetical protein LBT38_11055 [Deltaproteobacteria bacterium]|nr:hypothetical protein [Deltaproteobacteria bacterium]